MIKDWKIVPLSELADCYSGGTPRKDHASFWGGDIPWVTVKDMKSTRLREVTHGVTASGAATVRLVPAGTVLVLVRGMGLFKDLPVTFCHRPVTFNQDIKALVTKKGVDGEFLAYALTARKSRILRHVDSAGHGTGRLDTDLLKNTSLLLPPLPEQHKIAEILRTWDEAIEKLEELKAAKERCRNRLCSHLISLGEQGAPHVTFGKFLTESREHGSNGETARKISVKLYGKGAIEKLRNRTGSRNTRYYRRSAGQLIYSKLDFLNGAFAIVDQALDGFESTLDLPAFDVSQEVNVKWLIEYLTRPEFYSQQVHLARGQRKARRIAPDDFLASYVRLPSRAEQDRIVEILIQADRELSLEVQTLKLIKNQKRGLMQKLLTGEWRVTS